eukprot:5709119-Heterocapsa_arctica.AAC.1
MATMVGTLDPDQQAAFQIEFPDLLASSQAKPPKPQDGFQLAVRESSQAFNHYKRAVELKGKLQRKVALIERQLDEVRKELQESIISFEEAEK